MTFVTDTFTIVDFNIQSGVCVHVGSVICRMLKTAMVAQMKNKQDLQKLYSCGIHRVKNDENTQRAHPNLDKMCGCRMATVN